MVGKKSIQCRACAEKIFDSNAKNLFEQDDNEILLNIKILTGIRIIEDEQLPKHICTCCHLELYHAIDFRERCLKTENYLQRANPKRTQDPLNTPNPAQLEKNDILTMPMKTTESLLQSDHVLYIPMDTTHTKMKSLLEEDIVSNSTTLSISAKKTKVPLKPKHKKPTETHMDKDDKPATEISMQQSSTRRSLRKLNTPKKKLLKSSKTPVKKTVAVMKNNVQREASSLENTTHSVRHKLKQSSNKSKSLKELQKEASDNGELSDFPYAALANSLPTVADATAEAITEATTVADDQCRLKAKKKMGRPAKAKSQLKQKVRYECKNMYVCDLCGARYAGITNFNIHMLRHKGQKNHVCGECGIEFYDKYKLELHIRVKHKGEQPFKCSFCGKRFYSNSARVYHEKNNHIRDFKFECHACKKRYNTKTDLNKHAFLHTGLKPYRCDLCNVAFPRNPGLKIHFRTKQHQYRASEALRNRPVLITEITIPSDTVLVLPEIRITDDTYMLSDSIMKQFVN